MKLKSKATIIKFRVVLTTGAGRFSHINHVPFRDILNGILNGNSTDFVSQKIGSKSIGIGCCENGHEFLVRLRFTREANNKYSVIRLLYEFDDVNRELYERKKKEAAESYEAYLKYKAISGQRSKRNR